ncbi:MAG TPA: alpha/beta hydrolase [Bacteroidales bacterium]|nr:alpha/beta hydrolase [Bacteroidales bacterium]
MTRGAPDFRWDKLRAEQITTNDHDRLYRTFVPIYSMKDHSRYITDDFGRSFFLYEWLPEDPPSIRGVVQIVHGMMEHAGRYAPLAEYMTTRGFVVVAEDHFGHGRTAPDPKALGHLDGKKGWQGILRQLKSVMLDFKEHYSGLPFTLMGHSMGSILARHFAILHGEMLDALILSGPDHTTLPLIGAGRVLAGGSGFLYGHHYRNRMLNYLTYKTFNHHFKPNRTAFDWLTTDQETVDNYLNDPLCGYPSTSGFYRGMFHGLLSINRSRNLRHIPDNLPVLLYSGSEDAVGKFSSGPRRIARQLKEAGIRDITMRTYPGGRHEMHNESNRQEVFADIADWIVMKTHVIERSSI